MPIWTLVIDKIATLHDLENQWSLVDLLRAYAVLEFRHHIESERIKEENVNRKISTSKRRF